MFTWRLRDVYRHYSQPSGDFRQNCQFRQNRHFPQNRQPPKGHFWHPIKIASNGGEIGNFAKNLQKWRKWREWRKIVSLWRLSGPLEAGDFGDFSKNRQRAGGNGDKPLYRSPLAIFSKIANFAKIVSLQGATFGIQFKSPEAGDFTPFSPFSPLRALLDIST